MIWLRRLAALVFVLAVWQVAVWLQVAPERYLPPPWSAAEALARVVTTPDDMQAVALTLLRALAGFAFTVPLGIALGILGVAGAGISADAPALDRAVAAAAAGGHHSGLGVRDRLRLEALPVHHRLRRRLARLLQHGRRVLRDRRGALADRARLRLRSMALIRSIVLPHALPQIFIGVRIAASVSLIGSVVTDLFAGQDGIGYLLFERAFALRVPDVLALTVLCGLNGMLFNQMVLVLRRLVIGWHDRMMAEAVAA